MGKVYDFAIEQEKSGTAIKEIREDCKRYLRKKSYAGVDVQRKDTPRAWLLGAWKRQRGLCFWCKDEIPFSKATPDHFIALAIGGKHLRSNIVASCEGCNKEKGAKDLVEQSKHTGETVSSMVERSGMNENEEQRNEP